MIVISEQYKFCYNCGVTQHKRKLVSLTISFAKFKTSIHDYNSSLFCDSLLTQQLIFRVEINHRNLVQVYRQIGRQGGSYVDRQLGRQLDKQIDRIFLNWDSLHARLNSHYKVWSYKKKKHKKIKAYIQEISLGKTYS